jgi:hypothetical protein
MRPDLVLTHIRKLLAVPSSLGMSRPDVHDMVHVNEVGESKLRLLWTVITVRRDWETTHHAEARAAS